MTRDPTKVALINASKGPADPSKFAPTNATWPNESLMQDPDDHVSRFNQNLINAQMNRANLYDVAGMIAAGNMGEDVNMRGHEVFALDSDRSFHSGSSFGE